MSDYTSRTPLWLAGGQNLSDLAPLGLASDLVRDLLNWQRYFDQHFHFDRNWDSVEAARCYEAAGRTLHARLIRALPARTVTLDLWPVTGVAPRT